MMHRYIISAILCISVLHISFALYHRCHHRQVISLQQYHQSKYVSINLRINKLYCSDGSSDGNSDSTRTPSGVTQPLLLTSINSEDAFRFSVYLEHTDCFDVMFYVNYPCYIERAINVMQSCNVDSHKYRRITSVKLLKYKKPAKLGNKLAITTKVNRKGDLSASVTNELDVCVAGIPPAALDRVDYEELATMSNIVTSDIVPKYHTIKKQLLLQNEYKRYTSTFTIYPDEYGNEQHGGILTTRTIFNLFERARTNIVGGPKQLSECRDYNTYLFVGRISSYQLVSDLDYKASSTGTASSCYTVNVITQCIPIGDSMVDFFQQLSIDCNCDGSNEVSFMSQALLASAIVTVVSADITTGNTCSFTQRLKEQFFQNSEAKLP